MDSVPAKVQLGLTEVQACISFTKLMFTGHCTVSSGLKDASHHDSHAPLFNPVSCVNSGPTSFPAEQNADSQYDAFVQTGQCPQDKAFRKSALQAKGSSEAGLLTQRLPCP